MITMLKILGLPVLGYTAPQTIVNGNEPQGYTLGDACVISEDKVCTPWTDYGYETYNSLYAMSSSCCCEARNFAAYKLFDIVPLLGTSRQGENYYNSNTVEVNYDCNYKVNEANIPYISGELVDHDKFNYNVLPTTHIPPQNVHICDIINPNDAQRYYSASDVQYIVNNWEAIQGKTNTPATQNIARISCYACFGDMPGVTSGNKDYGFVMIARLKGTTPVMTDDCVTGYNRRDAATYASNSELTPNDGEYLAITCSGESGWLEIRHMFEYNAGSNSLGNDKLSDTGATEPVKINLNDPVTIYSNNTDGKTYPAFVADDLDENGIFAIMPLPSQSNVTSVCSGTTNCSLKESFANHIELSCSNGEYYISLYNSAISSYANQVGDLANSKTELGRIKIDPTYRQGSNNVAQGHWDVNCKIATISCAKQLMGLITPAGGD